MAPSPGAARLRKAGNRSIRAAPPRWPSFERAGIAGRVGAGLARLLYERHPEIDIIRLKKPTFTKPAPRDLRDEVEMRCQAVIQALAD